VFLSSVHRATRDDGAAGVGIAEPLLGTGVSGGLPVTGAGAGRTVGGTGPAPGGGPASGGAANPPMSGRIGPPPVHVAQPGAPPTGMPMSAEIGWLLTGIASTGQQRGRRPIRSSRPPPQGLAQGLQQLLL
jgi:hypothetical protein